jgi:acyl transferase domain-containing protein/NADPH:quinone reductase-like Zn-dependent oxidoreductase/NAD(P)-dependent dehydrogenase (short-subunit alcohol dehydrogenase family)/acyl carrier protein
MLESLNRFAHGFVAVPLILSCRRQGLFDLLATQGTLSGEDIARHLGARGGNLAVALRLFCSLGWLNEQVGRYVPTGRIAQQAELPDSLADLLGLAAAGTIGKWLRDSPGGQLRPWIDQASRRWDAVSPLMADFADGILVTPVLLGLQSLGLFERLDAVSLDPVHPAVRDEIGALFNVKGWGRYADGALVLTAEGRFAAERCLILATTASYASMLTRVDDLLFGNPAAVFARDEDGHEGHVDRTLNVLASGFQHTRFFEDLEEAVCRIFDTPHFAEQPAYVADTGCGDGTLLKTIYEMIRDRTARGAVLDRFPLRLIGIDYNRKSLDETARTLTGIPHLTVQGDIGDPGRIVDDLKSLGIDPDQVLHIRSFLDHDRPFQAPHDTEAAAARASHGVRSLAVDSRGGLIPAGAQVQSLVEHFDQWSGIVGRYGLMLLEVHSLDARTVERHIDQSENLHFDAYHALSRQHLVEADVFLLALAETGLLPKADFARRYPRTLPFTRITVNWLEKRPYRVRHPRPGDLADLLVLEAACWPEGLRTDAAELARRAGTAAADHLVIEQGGRVVAALYTQKIAWIEDLYTARHADLADLRCTDGSVLQLLGMNVLPELQDQRLGDQLLSFALQWIGCKPDIDALVGITRCRDYPARRANTAYADYVGASDEIGLPADPILRYHVAHGARIERILPDYRPQDADNDGHGVLIRYDLHDYAVRRGHNAEAAPAAGQDMLATVGTCIRHLLGPARATCYGDRLPLRDMGLDSLDLMELKALLSQRLGVELGASFFFQYGTAEAIAAHLRRHAPAEAAGAPVPNGAAANPAHDAGAPLATRRTVRRAAAGAHEPIAIVGMSCRFPGGDGLDGYWHVLREGIDAIGPVPPSRWDVEPYLADGRMATRFGGFLNQIDRFDAGFFRIAPREAIYIDPQHRILLETSWEALEHAGIDPATLAGSAAGVFAGIFAHDYETLQIRANPADDYDGYFGSGNSNAIAIGRLAYFYDFRGPALSVDTACSSSLVAVHLAVRALRSGECDLALAAGVSVIATPEPSITFSRAKMLAPDGRCKTFDAGADGYARSEGCGVVVLKRLSDALADGDTVLGVVRGTALNQDGTSNGLTAPSGLAQQDVIRQALADAGLPPDTITYLEAHGTGTALGDPVEVAALVAVFAPDRPRSRPLVIGSAKTNIGHTEAAAGMAGLIKTVLALRHGQIPRHLHFHKPNPEIAFEAIPAVVPTDALPWDDAVGPRRAGISGFGFSGTNAHVILEQAPPAPTAAPALPGPHLVPLSARTETALRSQARRWADWLDAHPDAELADIAYSAGAGRHHFDQRAALVAMDKAELRAALTGLTEGGALPPPSAGRPKMAFLFTGQGSQYAGMARGLYEGEPVFRAVIDQCDAALGLHPGLRAVMLGEPGTAGLLDQTLYTQPALFALEVGLARLWQSWGIKPDAVLGHSVGEYGAAVIAGALSLDDSLRLIAERARLMQALPPGGAMVAVLADPTRVQAAVARFGDALAVAAVNGPANVVVSGRAAAVEALSAEFAAVGVEVTRLTVSHAFHSPLMEPMLDAFAAAAGRLTIRDPAIPLVSNLTGRVAASGELARPAYWRAHVREAVQFAAGMATLAELGCTLFVEIGPKPVLLGMGRACIAPAGAAWLSSLRPGRDDRAMLLDSLGQLYVRGAAIDWAGPCGGWRPKLALPTYPFQRQRYWIDASQARRANPTPRRGTRAGHPLLGARLASASRDLLFEAVLAVDAPACLTDHRVHGRAVVPAASYLEMALAAAAVALRGRPAVVRDVYIQQVLMLPEEGGERIQSVLTPDGDEGWNCRICSLVDEQAEEPTWRLHALARIEARREDAAPAAVDLAALQTRIATPQSPDAFYEGCASRGLDYGPTFRGVEAVWQGEGEALGRVRVPVALGGTEGYTLHPAVLDACFQVSLGAFPASAGQDSYLPVSVETIEVSGRADGPLWSHARARLAADGQNDVVTVDIALLDEAGTVVARIGGLALKRACRQAVLGTEAWRDWLYRVDWRVQALPLPDSRPDFLPSPAGIAGGLAQPASVPTTTLWPTGYDTLVAALEQVSLDHVRFALGKLGWQPQTGERFTAALAERLGVIPRQHRLFGRLISMLAEDGLVRADGAGWQVAAGWTTEDPAPALAALNRRYPAAAAELDLFGRCAARLAEVLNGTQDPLQLLYPEGDLTSATDFYRDSLTFAPMNHLLRDAVAEALARLPADCKARIVEVGGGTGGATAGILPRLRPAQTDYVFTDVTALFTTGAQESFRDYPFVRYRVLDIEQDPAGQGFVPGSADLVIASNVLHATQDMKRTLAHVRSLLVPGGLLLLLEGTAQRRWIDLIFGLTEGWWRFTDADLRPGYPLMAEATWDRLLHDCGFDAVAALSPDLGNPAAMVQQAVIVARADASAAASAERWLLVAGGEESGSRAVAAALAGQISAAGRRCEVIDGATPPDAATAAAGGPLHGIVDLTGLDAAPLDGTGQATAAAALQGCAAALSLVQAAGSGRLPGRPALTLVTRGTVGLAGDDVPGLARAPVWGLGKVVALEHPDLQCRRIDLDPAAGPVLAVQWLAAELLNGDLLAAEGGAGSIEDQVALRLAGRYVARLVPGGDPTAPADGLAIPDAPSYALTVSRPGSPDNLILAAAERRPPAAGEVEIRVQAAGLNFLDLLDVLGTLPFARPEGLGVECAGEVVAVGPGVTGLREGNRVVAIAAGTFRRHVTVPADLVAPIPAGLSYEAAATIPVNYLTAWFALHEIGRIRSGEQVLIHAATGGTGLAAVRLAQAAGAEVLGTASPGKWPVLHSLGIARPMSSRSLDFSREVQHQTAGRGVDLVLNSLASDFIPASLTTLAQGGRFLEIGKTGIWTADQVAARRPDAAYHLIDLFRVMKDQPARLGALLRQVMAHFAEGSLTALPRTVFPVGHAVAAFRHMQQARHIGKVVLSFAPEAGAVPPLIAPRSDASYLITGGLGGLGLEVAGWLVERGARHLALCGRSAPSPAAVEAIAALEARGATVLVSCTDVSKEEEVAALLERIDRELPPLRGLVHSVGVLDDGVLLEQTPDRFATVLAPKVHGAWTLHRLTEDRPLDFFVLFSSAASLLGSAGQANHAAANAFLDALAWHRRARGLPALSVNWGAWSQVGAAAGKYVSDWMRLKGIGSIAPDEGIAALEYLMTAGAVQAGVLPMTWATFIGRAAVSPFLSDVAGVADTAADSQEAPFIERFEAAPAYERKPLLVGYLCTLIARVLGVEAGEPIPTGRGFFELGMDSLTSVELRNLLQRGLACSLPTTVALDYPSIDALARHLLDTVLSPTAAAPPPVAAPVAAAPVPAEPATDLAALSDSEAEACLLEQLADLSL